ncbi:hypothetical protein [Escherichia coli]|uniref:hypothetical protein n=1 Tax=Escherichia coli TaxID=562 RepID=UPI0027D99B25|nr:hypothetical protein [Escherichia coli]
MNMTTLLLPNLMKEAPEGKYSGVIDGMPACSTGIDIPPGEHIPRNKLRFTGRMEPN